MLIAGELLVDELELEALEEDDAITRELLVVLDEISRIFSDFKISGWVALLN